MQESGLPCGFPPVTGREARWSGQGTGEVSFISGWFGLWDSIGVNEPGLILVPATPLVAAWPRGCLTLLSLSLSVAVMTGPPPDSCEK